MFLRRSARTAEGLGLDFAAIAPRKPEALNVFLNGWMTVRALLDERSRKLNRV